VEPRLQKDHERLQLSAGLRRPWLQAPDSSEKLSRGRYRIHEWPPVLRNQQRPSDCAEAVNVDSTVHVHCPHAPAE